MKSNKVRMEINRNHHEWFKSQMGNTNNERMGCIRNKIETHNQTRTSLLFWHGQCTDYANQNSTLKRLLALSITVSIISVGYLAYAQGWFL
ncbi:TMhelix containing protein [Vibrio phage P23]|nr:TMhelix containing protein [Vibrio phage P23]